jgi:hypothetical protein
LTLAAAQRAQLVAQPGPQRPERLARRHPGRRGEAVGERRLRHRGAQPRVAGGGVDRVAAGERRPPHGDPRRVDALVLAQPRERGVAVLVLAAHVEQLARLAAARAEVPEVDRERGDAGGGEQLAVAIELLVARRGEAVHEQDRRHGVVRPVREVEPRRDGLAADGDLGVLAPHGREPSSSR